MIAGGHNRLAYHAVLRLRNQPSIYRLIFPRIYLKDTRVFSEKIVVERYSRSISIGLDLRSTFDKYLEALRGVNIASKIKLIEYIYTGQNRV